MNTLLSPTARDRCRTFPLDQLLEARRRNVMICLGCADDSEPVTARGDVSCINCGFHLLRTAEQIIETNLRRK